MSRIIVSAGTKTDIDVLACSVAYKNILGLLGKESLVLISHDFGGTVPPSLLEWGFSLDTISPQPDDRFVIVDISEPTYIDKRVNQDAIIELYDHHPGFELYWREKLGTQSVIEPIGACATLIYEYAERQGVTNQLETYSIDLLLTAIVSNTLNFKAQITHERDIQAYKKLRQVSTLPQNWSELYFREVERGIVANPKESLVNDTKILSLLNTNVVVGQIELWDSEDFMKSNQDTIVQVMESYGHKDWLYTSPSIGKGENNFFTPSEMVKQALTDSMGASFIGDFGKTKQLWLRKEICKKLM